MTTPAAAHADVAPVLTTREASVLAFVKWYLEQNQMPPSRHEIADALGYSTMGAQHCLTRLAAKGVIEVIPNVARGLRIK